jgi:hypothetical protein
MPQKRQGIHILVAALLSSCVGPLTPVAELDPQTTEQLNTSIAVYRAGQSPPNASIIEPITATSCKNKVWDSPATEENAINQLRLYTQQRRGNAVLDVTCDGKKGTELSTNCWESIMCRGAAGKVQ